MMYTPLYQLKVADARPQTIVSAAVLTGPPIEGLLIQNDNGKYLYAQIFAATVITVGCAFMAAARVAKSGWVWAVKM